MSARAVGDGVPADERAGVSEGALYAGLDGALQRILGILRPYLPDVVLIGGWVPLLHQRFGRTPGWTGRLSLTSEADVLVPKDLLPGSRPTVVDMLRRSGFEPVSAAAQAAAEWRGNVVAGEAIEFLVPHDGHFRTLNQVIPIGGQKGMGAMALSSLEILWQDTEVLRVPARGPVGEEIEVEVRVPRLGAYVLNKAATFMLRRPVVDPSDPTGGARSNPRRAKELVYLRDCAAGHGVLTIVEEQLRRAVAEPPQTPAWLQSLIDNE